MLDSDSDSDTPTWAAFNAAPVFRSFVHVQGQACVCIRVRDTCDDENMCIAQLEDGMLNHLSLFCRCNQTTACHEIGGSRDIRIRKGQKKTVFVVHIGHRHVMRYQGFGKLKVRKTQRTVIGAVTTHAHVYAQ